MRLIRLACLLLLPLAFAACDSGPEEPPTIEETTFAPSLNVDLSKSTKTASGLYYRDLTVGTGETPAVGDSVGIHYRGAFTNGQIFDQTEANEPFPFRFKVTGDRLIPGFEEGLETMKVGGRRQLIIPSDLGYGAGGFYPVIPPNAILVFEVELTRVKK